MSALINYLEREESLEKKIILKAQYNDAIAKNEIICECGQLRALVLAYRCLYCGRRFCTRCAEIHFGKTIREYRKEKH